MFTILTAEKHSRPFSSDEREWLLHLLGTYAITKEGEWLNSIPYRTSCEYKWCDAMTVDNGILGARPTFGSCIYLASPSSGGDNPEIVKGWLQCIASVAVHELRHMWQQHHYGRLLWTVLRLPEMFPPLYGKVLIERDAFAIEEEADTIIQSFRGNAEGRRQ